jgi:tRNA(Ile)-lysidine synthase
MEKALERFSECLFKKTVGVAVSGGRDSMALLSLFQASDYKFFAINIEHGIRGESSVSDSRFVKDYCQKNNIELKCFSANAKARAKEFKETLEQAARELRYGFFDSLLKSCECDYIALAHHADDNAETVLMHALRGAGLKGLCAMDLISGKYIRPLLPYSRSQIDDYVRKHAVPYVEDGTNAEVDASRNFLRNAVIPQIQARFPSCREALNRLSQNAREAEDFISGACRKPQFAYKSAVRIFEPFPHPAVFKREVMLCAGALSVFQDIEECHLNTLCELQSMSTGKRISLAHGLFALREPNSILIAKDEIPAKIDAAFNPPQTVLGDLCDYKIELSENINFVKPRIFSGEAQKRLFLDYDKIPKDAVIRYRKENDVFCKFGGGTKSLGDFFTDKKISVYERDRTPVLAAANDILAVFGLEISQSVKITEQTKKTAVITKV